LGPRRVSRRGPCVVVYVMGDGWKRSWARPAALLTAIAAIGGCGSILGLDWTPADDTTSRGSSGAGAGDTGSHSPTVGGLTSGGGGHGGDASSSSIEASSSSGDAPSSSASGGGECADAAECPGVDGECHYRTCEAGVCGEADAPARALCAQGVCDGSGECIECVVDDDCGKDGECAGRSCHFCKNDDQDGLETDVDCGGPVCPPCGKHETCLTDSDCKSSVCKGGTCEKPDEDG
jgi:hypothetical protein